MPECTEGIPRGCAEHRIMAKNDLQSPCVFRVCVHRCDAQLVRTPSAWLRQWRPTGGDDEPRSALHDGAASSGAATRPPRARGGASKAAIGGGKRKGARFRTSARTPCRLTDFGHFVVVGVRIVPLSAIVVATQVRDGDSCWLVGDLSSWNTKLAISEEYILM